ncbi:hypothetical protein HY967_01565 [Candidatus Jorgensenbacteria bacterium]|nr:hypothetical protein [Candidatus Jorgensenbacteria bacterium]
MIEQLLKNKTAKEKANFKGQEIAKLGSIQRELHGKYEIEITGLNAIEGGVEFYVRAWDLQGNSISLGMGVEMEHFRIFNPQILIDDLNGDIIKDYTDERGVFHKYRQREDLKETLLRDIEHTIFTHNKGINPPKGSIGSTTSTFYPATGANSPVDGFVRRSGVDQTWADVISGAGTTAGVSDTQMPASGDLASLTTNQWAANYRAIFTFDTSPIGTDDIASSTFSLYGYAKASAVGNTPNLDVYAATPAAVNNLAVADYGQVGSTSLSDAPISYNSFSTTGYNDFALNATGLANINKTGVSKFGTRSANYDVGASTPPSWNADGVDSLRVYFADNGSNQPKLVVVHSEATTGAAFLLNFMQP